jgi:hypothetical protein
LLAAYPLEAIEGLDVGSGALVSSVALRFKDGTTFELEATRNRAGKVRAIAEQIAANRST